MKALWPGITLRLPLLLFAGAYIFSCYLGALLLLVIKDFWAWTNYFSGPSLPPLDRESLGTLLLLLHAGPVGLWLGYELAVAISRRLWKAPKEGGAGNRKQYHPRRLVLTLYGLSAVGGLWSIARAGGFTHIAAWTDYSAFVDARMNIFATLTFFEYVNLYTWLPVLSACLFLSFRRWWLSASVLGILALFQLSLYQKKPLLTSIAIIACALWTYWYLGRAPRKPGRPRLWAGYAFALCSILYLIHAALTIRVVISSKPSVSALAQKQDRQKDRAGLLDPKGSEAVSQAMVTFDRSEIPSSEGKAVLLYAFFAPLTRTSVPAIAYCGFFPRSVPYYHLDIALDILGIGSMPDDNRVISRLLWPEQPDGRVAAPFHFVLYSQGGVLVALTGSFLLGLVLGVAWQALCAQTRLSVAGSLVASLLLTFAWLNAIDSVRNNFWVSYGVVWGTLPVALIYFLENGHYRWLSVLRKSAAAPGEDSVMKGLGREGIPGRQTK